MRKTKKYFLIGAGEQMKAVILDLITFGKPDDIIVADIDPARAKAVHDWAWKMVPADYGSLALFYIPLDAFDKTAVVDLLTMTSVTGVLINCAGNAMNPTLTAAAIEAGWDYVDIGQDDAVIAQQFQLHDAAVKAGIKAVPACGIAPGSLSIVVMHAIEALGGAPKYIRIRCGGIPQEPEGPLSHKATFSMDGMLLEYMLPAAALRKGVIEHHEAMTGLETHDFRDLGTLEAAYTGGNTGTLIQSFEGQPVDIDYKTLRYPGHWQKMMLLKQIGFLDASKQLKGSTLSFRDATAAMLSDHFGKAGPDVLLLRVMVGNDQDEVRLDLEVRLDPVTGLSGMQQVTGSSASIIAQMLMDGTVKEAGVLRQERSIPHAEFLEQWERRGIHVAMTRRQGSKDRGEAT